MVALLALSGLVAAQTKKPQPAAPKTEQKTGDKQDAPPPQGPEGFGPGKGMGPGRMGPGMMGPGMMGRQGFRPGQGRGEGFGPGQGMGPGRMGGKRGHGMMFLGLGLTDDQKTKIQGIMKSAKPTDAQRDEMRSLMQAARAGLLTEAQQTRLKAIRDEQRTKREANHTQVMAILTAEQKAKLEERRFMQMRRDNRQRPQMRRKGNRGPQMGPGQRGPGQRGPQGDRQGPPPPPREEEN